MNATASPVAGDVLVAEFKRAMRRLTSTVAIITTSDGTARYGMAVTAVFSVGIAPPSLAICVAKTASMHDPLLACGRFCVNLLRPVHAQLLVPFSGQVKGEARFALGEWGRSAGNLPSLVDAQASLACDVAATLPYAGHTLIIGRVIEAQVCDDIDPLLYQNGAAAAAYVVTP